MHVLMVLYLCAFFFIKIKLVRTKVQECKYSFICAWYILYFVHTYPVLSFRCYSEILPRKLLNSRLACKHHFAISINKIIILSNQNGVKMYIVSYRGMVVKLCLHSKQVYFYENDDALFAYFFIFLFKKGNINFPEFMLLSLLFCF